MDPNIALRDSVDVSLGSGLESEQRKLEWQAVAARCPSFDMDSDIAQMESEL